MSKLGVVPPAPVPPSPGPSAASAPAPKRYRASVWPKNKDIDPGFGALVEALEKEIGCRVWVIVQPGQDDDDPWDMVSEQLYRGFRDQKSDIVVDAPVALLVHSPGGSAQAAYEIVRLFQRRTKEFVTVVPVWAKSAATLVAVGGREILMGMEAELGPLDVQVFDHEKDAWGSALNVVQSFERLNAYALTAYDQAMTLFGLRTRKKPLTLMPLALQYATSIVGPMAEKIDTLEVAGKSRELKVAEDYAIRIMRPYYPGLTAQTIARSLVQIYSAHSFVIDRTEAGKDGGTRGYGLGLNLRDLPQSVEDIFTKMTPYLEKGKPIAGRIEVVP